MIKILLAEDDDLSREMLSRRLGKKGYDVIVAEDGRQAIDMATAERPDVILMDVSMPEVSGLEATSHLKGEETTREIPVIVLTAHALNTDRDAAFAAGCDDYATKPINLSALLEKIQALSA